jgi:hypothetical protein
VEEEEPREINMRETNCSRTPTFIHMLGIPAIDSANQRAETPVLHAYTTFCGAEMILGFGPLSLRPSPRRRCCSFFSLGAFRRDFVPFVIK